MPSSHAAITTYFVATYLYLNYVNNINNINNKTINYTYNSGLILYLYLVLLSRYKKHCHSLQQLVAGTSLGLFVFLYQYKYMFEN